jgi:hypothetical protein
MVKQVGQKDRSDPSLPSRCLTVKAYEEDNQMKNCMCDTAGSTERE